MRFAPLRVPVPPMLRRVFLVVLCGVAVPEGLRAEEPQKAPAGEVRLANGRAVEYTIHYDRNSLRDSVRLGNNLIGVTTSVTFSCAIGELWFPSFLGSSQIFQRPPMPLHVG